MSKIFLVVCALVLSFATSGLASPVNFTAVDVDGVSDLTVTISIEDVTDGVMISANVVGGPADQIGDLIGLFFMYDGPVPETVNIIDVSSNDETPTVPPIGYSTSGAPGWNFASDMAFFLIGDQGIPPHGWDIQWVIYTVDSTPTLVAANFLSAGARVTSVGTIGGAREDSLKLVSDRYPDTPGGEGPPIPEPSTWLMIGGGLLALGMVRRYRKA
jgi:hypothetical protein